MQFCTATDVLLYCSLSVSVGFVFVSYLFTNNTEHISHLGSILPNSSPTPLYSSQTFLYSSLIYSTHILLDYSLLYSNPTISTLPCTNCYLLYYSLLFPTLTHLSLALLYPSPTILQLYPYHSLPYTTLAIPKPYSPPGPSPPLTLDLRMKK